MVLISIFRNPLPPSEKKMPLILLHILKKSVKVSDTIVYILFYS